MKGEYDIRCSNGTFRLFSRPRPSSIAERNFVQEDDDEIEGNKMDAQQRIRGL